MALERHRALLLILLVTLLACAPSLGFDFVEWDDPLHLTRNSLVLEPARMSLREHVLTPALGYPIPLTIFSYRVEHMLAGLTPWPFHATNALLHTLVTALAFTLGRKLGLSSLAAATAALFFALHPANAETMSWVSGRKDLLAASFGLTALLMSLGGKGARVLSVLLYACALLCKPAAAPIAALVVLLPLAIESAPSTGPFTGPSLTARAKEAALRIAPYLVVLLPIAYLGILGQAAVGATSDEKLTSISPVLAALYAAGHHASLVLGWVEPTVKYFPTEWPPHHPAITDAALAVLVVGVALAIFVCRGLTRRVALFGAAFSLLAYLPSSSLLFPLTRYLADAYVYLPLMGLGLVLGAALDRAIEVAPRLARGLIAVPLVLAIAFVPSFVMSSSRFKDDLALWSHARMRYPDQDRICRNWSNAVVTLRGPAPGLAAIDTCIARFGEGLFAKNKSVVLTELGRVDEAREWLERARSRAPANRTIESFSNPSEGSHSP